MRTSETPSLDLIEAVEQYWAPFHASELSRRDLSYLSYISVPESGRKYARRRARGHVQKSREVVDLLVHARREHKLKES